MSGKSVVDCSAIFPLLADTCFIIDNCGISQTFLKNFSWRLKDTQARFGGFHLEALFLSVKIFFPPCFLSKDSSVPTPETCGYLSAFVKSF